jgi:hypothetical protein
MDKETLSKDERFLSYLFEKARSNIMGERSDWLPGRRELQLAMARRWHSIIGTKASAWHIPASGVAELDGLATNAADCLQIAQSTDRTAVTTAQCKAVFDALIAKMRFLKSHYFLTPPLTDEDYVALGVKPKDATPATVPPPTSQAEAGIAAGRCACRNDQDGVSAPFDIDNEVAALRDRRQSKCRCPANVSAHIVDLSRIVVIRFRRRIIWIAQGNHGKRQNVGRKPEAPGKRLDSQHIRIPAKPHPA